MSPYLFIDKIEHGLVPQLKPLASQSKPIVPAETRAHGGTGEKNFKQLLKKLTPNLKTHPYLAFTSLYICKGKKPNAKN